MLELYRYLDAKSILSGHILIRVDSGKLFSLLAIFCCVNSTWMIQITMDKACLELYFMHISSCSFSLPNHCGGKITLDDGSWVMGPFISTTPTDWLRAISFTYYTTLICTFLSLSLSLGDVRCDANCIDDENSFKLPTIETLKD